MMSTPLEEAQVRLLRQMGRPTEPPRADIVFQEQFRDRLLRSPDRDLPPDDEARAVATGLAFPSPDAPSGISHEMTTTPEACETPAVIGRRDGAGAASVIAAGGQSPQFIELAAVQSLLDAGVPISTYTQIALPGSDWAANGVFVTQSPDALSVEIDFSDHRQPRGETLAELERRLRARGLAATVKRSGS